MPNSSKNSSSYEHSYVAWLANFGAIYVALEVYFKHKYGYHGWLYYVSSAWSLMHLLLLEDMCCYWLYRGLGGYVRGDVHLSVWCFALPRESIGGWFVAAVSLVLPLLFVPQSSLSLVLFILVRVAESAELFTGVSVGVNELVCRVVQPLHRDPTKWLCIGLAYLVFGEKGAAMCLIMLGGAYVWLQSIRDSNRLPNMWIPSVWTVLLLLGQAALNNAANKHTS